MHHLLDTLLHLTYASLVASTATLVLVALDVTAIPALWSVVGTFLLTFPYHATILFLARREPHNSPRFFSALNVAWTFVLSVLWAGCVGVLVAFSVLGGLGKIGWGFTDGKIWMLITPAVTSLVESVLILSIALHSRRERKKILYAAKWRFSTSFTSSQTWSIARTPTITHTTTA